MSEEMTKVAEVTTAEVQNTSGIVSDAPEVRSKLAEYKIETEVIDRVINDLGTETLDDLKALTVDDLTQVGMKVAKARRIVNDLNTPPEPPKAPASISTEDRAIAQSRVEALLPQVPNDESWLSALKTGGVLKVDESSYIAAIRAALAERVGLYDIPESLSRAMEAYADETDEQVPAEFYTLRRSLTRRAYGEIFSAIDGLDSSFITDKRRKVFLKRIQETLWPAIIESYQALNGWYQTYHASVSDPSVLLTTVSQAINGGGGIGMVASLPDTAQLHDAGDALIASINRVFRGTGVQVAAAMAYDANTIRKTLEESHLPAMLGVKNREEMLRKINANVSSNYVRLEQNVAKYVLGFVRHNNVTSDIEVSYFVALWQLGNQINWSDLLGGKSTAGFTGLTGDRIL